MPCLAFPGDVGTGWHDAAVRYSVNVPNFGEFAAPEVFAEVARRAEEAGWDALLVWDRTGPSQPWPGWRPRAPRR